jgi:hypothetical protein
MMLKKTTLAAALALAMQVQWSATCQAGIIFDTGNEFLSMCGDSGLRIVSYCGGATTGYFDMLQTMGETCAAGSYLTREQIADVVLKYLRDHPEARNRSAASQARAALIQAFPCPKN